MATTARVAAECAKGPRGLTLRELQRFIDEALVAGFDPDDIPNVSAGFRLGIRRIEITGSVNPP